MRPNVMALPTGQKYLDTRLNIRVGSIDGSDAAWDEWGLRFQACCDLAGIGEYLDIARESSFAPGRP